MARPRKSVNELKLTGAYRADRHGGRGDTLATVGRPKRPRSMKGEARKFWDAVVPGLTAAGVVGSIDSAALTACCEMWGLYRAALAIIENDPTNKDARIAATSYLTTWERLASKCGLTPTDRQRLKFDLPAGPDEFDEWMNGGKARYFDPARDVDAAARKRGGPGGGGSA